MTREELIKRVETFFEGAKENFKKDGKLHPITFLMTADGTLMPIIAPMPDDQSKDSLADVVRTLIRKTKAEAVLMVNEAWYLKNPKLKKGDPLPKPSEHADRQEAIVIFAETREHVVTALADIDGKTRAVGELTLLPDGQTRGRFTHFFGPREVK